MQHKTNINLKLLQNRRRMYIPLEVMQHIASFLYPVPYHFRLLRVCKEWRKKLLLMLAKQKNLDFQFVTQEIMNLDTLRIVLSRCSDVEKMVFYNFTISDELMRVFNAKCRKLNTLVCVDCQLEVENWRAVEKLKIVHLINGNVTPQQNSKTMGLISLQTHYLQLIMYNITRLKEDEFLQLVKELDIFVPGNLIAPRLCEDQSKMIVNKERVLEYLKRRILNERNINAIVVPTRKSTLGHALLEESVKAQVEKMGNDKFVKISELLKVLMQRGLDVSIRNIHGKSVLGLGREIDSMNRKLQYDGLYWEYLILEYSRKRKRSRAERIKRRAKRKKIT